MSGDYDATIAQTFLELLQIHEIANPMLELNLGFADPLVEHVEDLNTVIDTS